MKSTLLSLMICLSTLANAQSNIEPTIKERMPPVRILWKSDTVRNGESLLKTGNGQADLNSSNLCMLEGDSAGILLDFGQEIHGAIQIVTGMWPGGKPVTVRIRLGESASEAMAEIGEKGATNDHAIRDFITKVPWLGKSETGNSGFRFARIDLKEKNAKLYIKEVNALAVYRDIPYEGSFNCSDTALNRIWKTGAYTVHMNMQDYLWDGIKRDRLVWVGDMHPEVATIHAVFGSNEVIDKSLDLSRDITPLPQWMNGISAYSMWWIIIQKDCYLHTGNLEYLTQQKEYLTQLLDLLITRIDSTNSEVMDGNRFLDWPSSGNPSAIHAGLQALMVMSLDAGVQLKTALKEDAGKYTAAIARLKKNIPPANGSKQAAALLALSGLMPAGDANTIISAGGAQHFSTFYGYYMLQAMAKAGNYQGAMDIIRTYWGAMLNLGATTFWEDFNMDWMPDAGRIDELVPPGKKDIHGDYGAYCYAGFRHSLSHGWASGPTPWLTEHILGVEVIKAGCKEIRIIPHLGDLQFAEGTYPTPYGIIRIRHEKQENGKIKSTIKAPREVKIIQ